MAKLIDGRAIAERVYAELRDEDKMCRELALYSVKLELPATTTQEELLAQVDELNRDEKIHGILVQSPPPPQIDEVAILRALDPRKDVDGFHPLNVAKLALDDDTGFVPCTPLGCLRLLRETGVALSGANVAVLGRSMIVGKPMALLLMRKGIDATVTVIHSRTRNIVEICRRADVIIAAIGRPHFVRTEFVREGATVVDVGINRMEDAVSERGYKLVGDVDFENVSKVAGAITPVPGGVGPMTIAMLMSNTIKACRQITSFQTTKSG